MTRPSSPQATIINLDTWRKRQTARPKTDLTEDLRRLAAVEQRPQPARASHSGPALLQVHICSERDDGEAGAVACAPKVMRQPLLAPTAALEANLDRLLTQLDTELNTLNQRLNLVLNLSGQAADQDSSS